MELLLLFGILLAGLLALLAGSVPIRGRPEKLPLREHYLSTDNCKTTTATGRACKACRAWRWNSQNYLSLHVNDVKDWAGASAGALPA